MYRGPDCISQIYGARLKPIHDDALTSNLHASGTSIGTPTGKECHREEGENYPAFQILVTHAALSQEKQ